MKKLYILLSFISLLSIPVSLAGQPDIPVKLGLKLAPNIGWMSAGTKGYSSDGPRFGMTVGFVSDIYFAENYCISTGFNFQFLNGKMNYADSVSIPGVPGLQYGQVHRNYNLMYLEIPIMVKMQTKIFGKTSFFGQIGLGTGFRVRAKVNEHFVPVTGEPVDQEYDYNGGTTLIRESLLVGVGCEFHLDESSRIFFGLNYCNGLNNILTGTNYISKLNEKSVLSYAELNLGILF